MGPIRVGTSGWAYPSWVGPFYPQATSAARMLPYYARHFDAVEAHSTHRRLPTPASLARWSAQVPATFRFVPKAHAGITHRRDLEGVGDRVAAFLAALEPLGDRLGAILYVLPHRRPDLRRLDALLSALTREPVAHPAVFELASTWWTEDVRQRLAAARASLALVDRDGQDVAPDGLPQGTVAYVRLRRDRYSSADLATWSGRLQRLAAEGGGRPVYAFFKHDEQGDGPRYARALVQMLERA